MSREQWGHGYWKGVKDAESGKTKTIQTGEVEYWITTCCLSNKNKSCDKGLFPVREFIALLNFAGFSVNYAKKIYDYLLANGDFDTGYISGTFNGEWTDDYIILPYFESESDLRERRKKALDLWNKANETKVHH